MGPQSLSGLCSAHKDILSAFDWITRRSQHSRHQSFIVDKKHESNSQQHEAHQNYSEPHSLDLYLIYTEKMLISLTIRIIFAQISAEAWDTSPNITFTYRPLLLLNTAFLLWASVSSPLPSLIRGRGRYHFSGLLSLRADHVQIKPYPNGLIILNCHIIS